MIFCNFVCKFLTNMAEIVVQTLSTKLYKSITGKIVIKDKNIDQSLKL